MAERRPAHFTGVNTYQDPLGRFSFRYPTDWHRLELEGREGVMFAPEAHDSQTALTAWVAALEYPVVAEDLEDLRAGVGEGLAKLADCRIESQSEVVLGNLIKVERVFTFREGGATRKRKLWLLYVDKWLISLTWQGATEDDYEHWLSMANYSYATFTIPEALWFATDRDLVGYTRAQQTTDRT
jgi:hypothetical protein